MDRSRYSSILSLAWPVFVGQLAVMLNSVIDVAMAGRLSPTDMAAVGLGSSIYVSIYIAAIGVILALTPVLAQQYGAKDFDAIGRSFAQGVWLALLLSIPAAAAMAWNEPWLRLSQPPPGVAAITRDYLLAVTAGIPAALLFRSFYALSNAVSLPKAIMFVNLMGLALKVPLNALFMYGLAPAWSPLSLPALGGAGCGVATAVIAWLQIFAAASWLRRPEYRRFALFQDWRRRWRPQPSALLQLLRLGLPIGAAYLIEVTSFTFMAIFVARLGERVAASHQIAANLAGVVYMTALALSNATTVLVGQAIGAGERHQVLLIVRRGALLAAGAASTNALLLLIGNDWLARFYTSDDVVRAAAVPLLLLLAVFHWFDACQTFCAFVLRAFKITVLPSAIYIVALWGIGLGGGWLLTMSTQPEALRPLRAALPGAGGFWAAALLSLVVASALLGALLVRTVRRYENDRSAPDRGARGNTVSEPAP